MKEPIPQLQLRLSVRTRRGLVALEGGLLLGVVALTLLVPLRAALPLWALALLGLAAVHTTLAGSVHNLAQARLEHLDERQRAARERALVLSHRVLSGVLGLFWLGVGLAQLAERAPSQGQLWLFLFALTLLAYGLPTAIAAWLEPEPLPL